MAKSTNDALQVALEQFNDGLKTQLAEEQAEKQLEKANWKRQQAATNLKAVLKNPDTSLENKAKAEAEYREAVEVWNKIKSSEQEPQQTSEAEWDSGDTHPEAETTNEGSQEEQEDHSTPRLDPDASSAGNEPPADS